MADHGATTDSYELYYNPFSICSLMVLMTLGWKREPKSADLAVEPVEKVIEIYAGEQFSEDFLEKNWKGQVPVLLGPQSIKILDSLDITHFLMERYPHLLPTAHSEAIKALLKELHEVNYLCLSFRAGDFRVEGIMEAVQGLQAAPTTSEKYKEALGKKVQYMMGIMPADPFGAKKVGEEELKSRTYLEKIAQAMAEHNKGGKGSWIFGDDVGPTALDAHTVVFIARLMDAGRPHLIGDEMAAYGKLHMGEREWMGITKGNPTLHTLWEKQQKEKKG